MWVAMAIWAFLLCSTLVVGFGHWVRREEAAGSAIVHSDWIQMVQWIWVLSCIAQVAMLVLRTESLITRLISLVLRYFCGIVLLAFDHIALWIVPFTICSYAELVLTGLAYAYAKEDKQSRMIRSDPIAGMNIAMKEERSSDLAFKIIVAVATFTPGIGPIIALYLLRAGKMGTEKRK